MNDVMHHSHEEGNAIRRLSSQGTIAYGLPRDIAETGVQRLGFLGLVVSLMAPCTYMVEYFFQHARVAAGSPGFPQAVTALLFVIGAATCVVAWSHAVKTDLMLDLGLIFLVLVAFGIALYENVTPWEPDHPVRGISWNCLWISMYVVAVPGTYGKSVLAAIAAACMAPFGMLAASAANHYPLPLPRQALVLLLPPFVAAAWAIPAGRYLYRLSAQVSKARAMGSYELVELIGKGGMGEVWSARHRMLARLSAIKLIRPEMLGTGELADSGLMQRFEREARATAGLRSPHTVVLYDYGVSGDGHFYYVMELLDGLDLETLVQRFGPQPDGRVVFFLLQAAKSLAEAHGHGLVHRDIKPRNLFSCRMGTEYDFIKVLDFGLVKICAREDLTTLTDLTPCGAAAGTPAYMAPELAIGNGVVDARADLYSLGCVGYWLLTGQPVFEGANAMATALAHVQHQPVPPSCRTRGEISTSLESVILACLEKNPTRRPQSARELASLLAACECVEPWGAREAEQWWQTQPARVAAAVELHSDAHRSQPVV